MRLGSIDVVKLGAVPFVLLGGAVMGALSVVSFVLRDSNIGAAAAHLVGIGAAIAIWWFVVCRLRHSVWSAAFQLMCVNWLGRLIMFAFIAAWVHHVAPAVRFLSFDIAENRIAMQLWEFPVSFLGLALLVFLGRFLFRVSRAPITQEPAASR